MPKRYFIGRDSDGHEYLVEAEMRFEWQKWLDIPEEDVRSWQAPDFTTILNGQLTFECPLVMGKDPWKK